MQIKRKNSSNELMRHLPLFLLQRLYIHGSQVLLSTVTRFKMNRFVWAVHLLLLSLRAVSLTELVASVDNLCCCIRIKITADICFNFVHFSLSTLLYVLDNSFTLFCFNSIHFFYLKLHSQFLLATFYSLFCFYFTYLQFHSHVLVAIFRKHIFIWFFFNLLWFSFVLIYDILKLLLKSSTDFH